MIKGLVLALGCVVAGAAGAAGAEGGIGVVVGAAIAPSSGNGAAWLALITMQRAGPAPSTARVHKQPRCATTGKIRVAAVVTPSHIAAWLARGAEIMSRSVGELVSAGLQ